MSDLGDWFFDNLGKVIVILVGLLIGATIATGIANSKAREQFMAECTQHRENYECVAMWRAGEQRDHFYPVVVPIR